MVIAIIIVQDGLNMSEDKLPALVLVVKKRGVWEWTGFIWLGIRTRVLSCCEDRYGSEFHKVS
jgi:hypothetical protein